MAGKMWAQGAVPYVDFVENKPPGIFLLYALPHFIGLDSLYWMHALALPWVLGTAWIVGRAAALLSPSRPLLAERLGALLYLLLTAAGSPRQYLYLNTEIASLLPLAGALWCYSRARLNEDLPRLLFASGALVAAACLFRQPSGVVAILLGLDLLLPSPGARRPRASVFLRTAAFALGGLFLAGIATFYLAGVGAIQEGIYWIFSVNRDNIAMRPPLGFQLRRFGINVFPSLLIALPVWMSLRWVIQTTLELRDVRRRLHAVFAALSLVLLWTTSLKGIWLAHYYLPALAPLAALAAALWCEPGKTARLRVAMSALVLAGVAALAFSVTGAVRSVQGSFEEVSLPMRQAARRIGELTRDSDKIYIWGFGQTLYYRSRRLAAGRFIMPYTSISGYLFGKEEILGPADSRNLVVEGHRKQFLEDLRSQRPVLFLDYAENDVHHFGRHPISGFPELSAWLSENYERLPDEGPVVFYRRKNS